MVREQTWIWSFALTIVFAYCVVQSVRDFRARRYGWAMAGLIAALLIVYDPFPTIPITYFPEAR